MKAQKELCYMDAYTATKNVVKQFGRRVKLTYVDTFNGSTVVNVPAVRGVPILRREISMFINCGLGNDNEFGIEIGNCVGGGLVVCLKVVSNIKQMEKSLKKAIQMYVDGKFDLVADDEEYQYYQWYKGYRKF